MPSNFKPADVSVYIPCRSCHRQLQSQHPQCATSPPLQRQEAVKPTASTVTPPGFHWEKMADRYPEIGKLSSCELGHTMMVVVRTRRYFSSWHQARGSAGRAIAHWGDASIERTIIVVPNSSWCLLCAMLKIAFYTKNRIRIARRLMSQLPAVSAMRAFRTSGLVPRSPASESTSAVCHHVWKKLDSSRVLSRPTMSHWPF